MPYPSQHKPRVRARIVDSARRLFNRRGFTEVTIDEIMAGAGLTRGGFYNHFRTKEELFAETLAAYASERQAEATADDCACGPGLAVQLLNQYVSREHLADVDNQCPLIALPSDAARAGPTVRQAYRDGLEGLAGMFETGLADGPGMSARQRALALAATCVGAMVLARTIDDQALADEVCDAARAFANEAIAWTAEAN